MNHIFICGGAYSGKTDRAAALASAHKKALWIGTSSEMIPELKARVAFLRSRRPPHWEHISAPLNLPEALRDIRSDAGFDVIVVDSVSQWIANNIAHADGKYDEAQIQSIVDRECGYLIESLIGATRKHSVIAVSGELGMSLPPDNFPQRLLRRLNGTVNQELARVFTNVEFLINGLVAFKK